MAGRKALEFSKNFRPDTMAEFIAHSWDTYNKQRMPKVEEWTELRNYIFATDTSTTTAGALPWKNSTTIPKLCQIRDNLHSNYVSALFPNDNWMRWEAYTSDASKKEKKMAIQAYMSNKCRESDFRTVTSQLLYDYIDYGNAFATVFYENATVVDEDTGEVKIDYMGPRLQRISPLDIVFNPTSASFKDSFKIIRSVKTFGEFMAMAEDQPDNKLLADAVTRHNELINFAGRVGLEETNKSIAMSVDGFGNYYEYLMSGYIEVLDFYGDIFDPETKAYQRGKLVTVIDRAFVARNESIPSWFGHAPIYQVGWRFRQDNLWAMGPLDNLVGMQYRLDHLENLKADAMDLAVLPPLKVIGDVEEFDWHPGAEIHIDGEGDVQELGKNAQWVIQAESQMQMIEQRMEMYAGAPREAMGVRTPGEKTAFEVQQLQNASGRIFQEKINQFETELLEKVLNAMLEVSRRNLNRSDTIRVIDNDLGVEQFKEITKEDITAAGVIRPIGARHFAAQAQLMQNLSASFNSPMFQMIAPHISSKRLAELWADNLGLERYGIVQPNIAVFEQQETQQLVQQTQEQAMIDQQQSLDAI